VFCFLITSGQGEKKGKEGLETREEGETGQGLASSTFQTFINKGKKNAWEEGKGGSVLRGKKVAASTRAYSQRRFVSAEGEKGEREGGRGIHPSHFFEEGGRKRGEEGNRGLSKKREKGGARKLY